MAFEMMKYVESFNTLKGKKLKLKIGIHQGDVIAGVIGEKKPQFSLIGDTVNTTSRVCSTGDSGEITLSEEALKSLSNFSFSFIKKTVEAKGKGFINVYQIKKRSTNSVVKFHKIAQLILDKIREENGNGSRKISNKKQSILKFLTLFKQSKTLNESSTKKKINDFTSLNDHKIIENLEKKPFSPREKNKNFKNKQVGLKFEIFKNTAFNDSKFVLSSEKKKTNNKPIKKLKIKQKTKFSRKIIPTQFAKKMTTFCEVKKNKEEDFFMFHSWKTSHNEFLQTLVLKHYLIEKIIFIVLFFFSIIRMFLILSLIDFFEQFSFFLLEVTYLFMLGFTLLYLKEFYSKINKIKFVGIVFLIIMFSLGIGSSLLEMYYSKIYENYSTSLMNIIVLHMVLTNIWYLKNLIF